MAYFNADNQAYVPPPMLRNPFASPAPSRVTASGFTESSFAESTIIDQTKNDIDRFLNVKPMSRNGMRRDSMQPDEQTDITAKIKALNVNKSHSVRPDDSVSRINDGGRVHNALSSIDETGTCIFNEVVGGYQQTAEEKLDEMDAISSIQKITGLPIIFTNTRLNFLIHLHKPLLKMLGRDGVYPVEDVLYRITGFVTKYRGKQRNSHDDLLYQVIRTTFKDNKVRANPFNIPLLEVGMLLNDKLIFMSFTQLYNEYQIEWFKSMKDIEAPTFHSQFRSYKTKDRDRTSHPKPVKRRHTSGSSILSFGI